MEHRAVLCPGWGTDPSRLERIRSSLERFGVPAATWSYSPSTSVARLAERLADEVGRRPVLHLVGHSLGGLIVAHAALGPLAGHVASVTTVNTPWRGTWLGYTGSGALAESLRYGSEELSRLRRQLATHLADEIGPSWLAVGAAGDLGTPPSTALRPPRGDRLARRLIGASGHSQSLANPRLVAAVAGHVIAAAGPVSARARGEDRPGGTPEQITA